MNLPANSEGQFVLHVDGDDYPWRTEGGPWWLPTPGFGDVPIISMALLPGVLRAGATKDSIIIVDESGRCLDSPADLMELETPCIFLSDGTEVTPWEQNGAHLFICQSQLFFMDIYDSLDSPGLVGVRLFLVKKCSDGTYALLPVSGIGEFSLYVGANQSFVLPSQEPHIGRLSNTVYVEDFRGGVRKLQMLAINFDNLGTTIISYPKDVLSVIEELLPAVWVGVSGKKETLNHCKSGGLWRFWDCHPHQALLGTRG